MVCPSPSGDEELQIDLGSTAIFSVLFIPQLGVPETLVDEGEIVGFFIF